MDVDVENWSLIIYYLMLPEHSYKAINTVTREVDGYTLILLKDKGVSGEG